MNENEFHLAKRLFAPRFSALLREAKLRVTPQRLAVLHALASGRHIASCQAIWEKARVRCPDLGLVTVYRTLAGLRRAALVEQVEMGGTAHFGLVERHHDHIICQRCGTVAPMDSCLLGPLEGVRLAGSDFLVTGHRLDVLGVCRACRGAA